MREWMTRHPESVAALFAALAAVAAWDCFMTGRFIGAERALAGEADRLASAAMGG